MARVIIDVLDGPLREQVESSLKGLVQAGKDRESAALVVRGASRDAGEGTTPEVVLMPGSRARREFNPFASRGLTHVIGGGDSFEPGHLRSAASQVLRGAAIPLTSLLGRDHRSVTVEATSSGQRTALMEQLEELATEVGANRAVRTDVITAFDECFTNAMYNAPVDDAGSFLSAHKDRAEEVQSPRPVEVVLAADSEKIAISVRDNYGSLSPERLLEACARCFSQSKTSPEDKEGGAGLGLSMILQAASRVVFNICPGKYCEVIVLRRLNMRRKQFMLTSPTVNICRVGRRLNRMPVQGWPFIFEKDNEVSIGEILDITQRGCFVRALRDNPRLGEGDEILATLCMERDALPIYRSAVVRWVGHGKGAAFGFGVEFTEPLDYDPWEGPG